MPPDNAVNDLAARHDGWITLKRFLPYLWPRDNPALRWRIVVAVLLILAAKATTLALPFFYKSAIDRMSVLMKRRGRKEVPGGLGPMFGCCDGEGFFRLEVVKERTLGDARSRAQRVDRGPRKPLSTDHVQRSVEQLPSSRTPWRPRRHPWNIPTGRYVCNRRKVGGGHQWRALATVGRRWWGARARLRVVATA